MALAAGRRPSSISDHDKDELKREPFMALEMSSATRLYTAMPKCDYHESDCLKRATRHAGQRNARAKDQLPSDVIVRITTTNAWESDQARPEVATGGRSGTRRFANLAGRTTVGMKPISLAMRAGRFKGFRKETEGRRSALALNNELRRPGWPACTTREGDAQACPYAARGTFSHTMALCRFPLHGKACQL
jgi:hypothetical protein